MTKFLTLFLLVFLHSFFAFSQSSPNVAPKKSIAWSTNSIDLRVANNLENSIAIAQNGLPNIVLIGYWPPTNEMLREFSSNPKQNNGVWIGNNWEGLKYNIHSFFPEFSNGTGMGEGDFQVDYQDTAKDFWRIIPALKPVAVLSFGRSDPNKSWEIEMLTRNLETWYADYLAPLYPIPSPPNKNQMAGQAFGSKYPDDEVIRALSEQVPNINAYSDDNGAGSYLCEFLGYHLSWYQKLNPEQVRFAAHTHIGSESLLVDLKKAVKVSLRALIKKL